MMMKMNISESGQQKQSRLLTQRRRDGQDDAESGVGVADSPSSCFLSSSCLPRRNASTRRHGRRHSNHPRLLSYVVVVLLGASSLFPQATTLVAALIPCNTTKDCESLSASSVSVCHQDGKYCTNPFASGCLAASNQDRSNNKQRLQRRILRVCNSQDSEETIAAGICRHDPADDAAILNYPEVRIASQNWESPFFMAWILQIVLSELLGVPTTIETGVQDANLNFYDPIMPMTYEGLAYPWEALEVSKYYSGDCVKAATLNMSQPCAHVLLEVWSGYEPTTNPLTFRNIIEPRSFIGIIGEEAWWMPKYTVQDDPALLSWFGLTGEQNRQKLAQRFKRPTRWSDYCKQVSIDNCASPDNVTSRLPLTEQEGDHFYLEGVYNGHFRYTDENNCILNPNNCTGHFLDFPCGWTSYFVQQAHHLDIALSGSGDQPGSRGYTYAEMVEVWHAANFTKSDIIGMWWRPEALYKQYQGTDFELQPVVMPPPSQECLDSRVNATQRCSLDPEERVGSELGVCAVPASPNYKVVSTGLYDLVHNPNIPVPLQSPAHEVVKEFTMDAFRLGEIFEQWLLPPNGTIDKYGFDSRHAVCRWVQDNLEELKQQLIPRSYPREVQAEETAILSKIAIGLAFLAVTSTLLTTALTIEFRKSKSFVYAQIDFVFLLLFGLLQVSIAGVVTAYPPTDGLCLASSWLVNLGYTCELVPLVVKIAAIYRLSRAAAKMKRIKLSRSFLYGIMGVIWLAVVAYNILWTMLDPLKKQGDYQLTDTTNAEGSTIVTVSYFCSSSSQVWRLLAVGIQAFFLLCASLLAFLTRKSPSDVNETAVISFLIYWNFVCILIRLILILLGDSVDVNKTTAAYSMIFSVDTMVTLIIYFLPKFATKDSDQGRHHTYVTMNFQRVWKNDGSQGSGVTNSATTPGADSAASNSNPLNGVNENDLEIPSGKMKKDGEDEATRS